ncbi:hypothetical protein ENBRE01_3489, partial [Enteropsectra breve]
SDLLNNCMSMKSNATTVKIDSSMPVELEIAMKYINLINKVSSVSQEINIQMGDNVPVYFNIPIYDVLGYIRFYVAPKIEN